MKRIDVKYVKHRIKIGVLLLFHVQTTSKPLRRSSGLRKLVLTLTQRVMLRRRGEREQKRAALKRESNDEYDLNESNHSSPKRSRARARGKQSKKLPSYRNDEDEDELRGSSKQLAAPYRRKNTTGGESSTGASRITRRDPFLELFKCFLGKNRS